MTFFRPGRLRILAVCLVSGVGLFAQQTPPQQQPPKPATPQQPPQPAPQQKKKANPFETVPQSTEPKPETPKPTTPEIQTPERPIDDTIELIEFRGARRVPQDTLRNMIVTKKGDKYDEESLHRDFMALWNT